MNGKLFIVATPIGNLGDITERARVVLSEVDIVAAEDTRITQKLFRLLGIHNRTVQNHKFCERQQLEYLLGELKTGKSIAVVSDAGTPCISDPGSILVQSAIEEGIAIVGVCGVSAVITALSVSGFVFSSFMFSGFLPKSEKEMQIEIERMVESNIPVAVCFESPRRIRSTIALISQLLPSADLCLCNDLTKLYERIYRGNPHTVLKELDENPYSEKGEYTLVIRMPLNTQHSEVESKPTPEALLVDYIIKSGCSMKEAIATLSEKYRGTISKKLFYSASLRLREMLLTACSKEDY